MHVVAALGAILLSAALAVPTVLFTDARSDSQPLLADMEVIEASLAYKKPNAPKQPQKPKNAPVPEVKEEGVSRDEHKQPEEKKEEKKDQAKPDDVTDPLAKFRRKDEDLESGKTDTQDGASDGSELGRGNISKGDPYFQRLWADLDWTIPELARTGGLQTIACIVFSPDGKITKTAFKSKGDDDIATLAESAIRDLKTKRNAAPEEVPTHLLQRLTSKGICFNLTAK
jgi:outer membrane biosynthesis protein TonB